MGDRFIKIRGADENNLKHINLDIPKEKITAFVGVSGSGKTSVVYDTIAAESMRQLYDTFPLYVRNRMPYYQAPQAEEITDLSAAIVVDQKRSTADVRSTVGTMTDISPLLRLLYARFSIHSAGVSGAYSFNDPSGMCPACSGLGKIVRFDLDRVLDREKSLNEGAILMSGFQVGSYQWQMYANSGRFDNDLPLKDYTEDQWEFFLHGKDCIVEIKNTTGKVWDKSYKLTYEGFLDRINRLYLKKEQGKKSGKKSEQKGSDRFTIDEVCPVCGGMRLKKESLESSIGGMNIWELGNMEIPDLIRFLSELHIPSAEPMIRRIIVRLSDIEEIGLGYLNLNRPGNTLSGGEAQRLKIVKHLGTGLVGITYIFDEPSSGLHPRDVSCLSQLIVRLKKRGNTVLVVENDRDIIRMADHIVEMGPGAGKNGGRVIFQGTSSAFRKEKTPVARWLNKPVILNTKPIRAKEWIRVEHANRNNLCDVTTAFPKHALTAVTGVAGSGKSSLACGDLLAQHKNGVHISQAPIGISIRSSVASYMGIMDEIRKGFAKANRKPASLFSFNSKGACPVCGGTGVVATEMAFLEPVTVTCEACGGKRYNHEALSCLWKGKTIAEVLDLTVTEALQFFTGTKILEKLKQLQDTGIDYLTLGQPTSTLSGGECQRLKLAAHLNRRMDLLVMDEPSTGLHGEDIDRLTALLKRLVSSGSTVIVVEHRPDIIAQADWVIDMGPEGGKNGGHVLFEGTPGDLIRCEKSYTGAYLKRLIENGRSSGVIK
ncbi:MAG: excinuclease ABC subunit UvrA [Lachnospiraceae bacterium]|jgi:excinuclease UvrABC ATPase subunit|nr:excinuclease ABC subunit UvrA [Lachnospiraceae bacterium]MCI1327527.1 excinuclease ABC subunit UvrA [Lachnospiraceae bacterium]